MGWEHVPFQDVYQFRLEDLQYATAEGIVTLAAIVDSLRSGAHAQVELEIESRARVVSRALGLQQLVHGRWEESFPLTPLKAVGCMTHPLWRYQVKDRRACEKTALRISRQIVYLIDKLDIKSSQEISAAAKIVFQEALLNILEHAYPEKTDAIVFEAITISPVPRRDHLKSLPYVTQQESEWFAKHAGLMLEVAVADYGRNVPSSLWEAYKNEHPEAREGAASWRLGTREGQAQRANLHHDISLWSFNHKSTRKRPEEFTNELARLNWRGLHRVLNTAAKFDACVIMRSGQARVGFVFQEGKPNILEAATVAQHEFPGTGIILRIPLSDAHNQSVTRSRRPTAMSPAIQLRTITKATDLSTDLTDGHTAEAIPVGIVHPFRKYDQESSAELLKLARSISPHILSFHLFASLDTATLVEQLKAFESSPKAASLGPPRLMALWSPGTDVLWRFAGLMPELARSLAQNIEDHGVFNIPSDEKTRYFAEQLVRAYSPFIAIDKNQLQLKLFNSRLRDEDVDRAMQLAFESWSTTTTHNWLFDAPGTYVRLPTGRMVKRYVSLFKMLYSDESLAQAIGWRFTNIVRALKREHPSLCIVTESAASYFIARILLQDQGGTVDVYIGEPPSRSRPNRPILFFADAIYRGETLGTLIGTLRNCLRVVCCLDLRAEHEAKLRDMRIPIVSLLRVPFGPEELTFTPPETAEVLEVDRVTHIPVEGPPEESFLLGTNEQRVFFINENPHLFRYGLHISNGRLHVVSLSNNDIVEKYRESLLHWVRDTVTSHLENLPSSDKPIDVIFFSRSETHIKEIVKDLGAALSREVRGVNTTFSSVLPFVPAGLREIFGRPTQELCYGLLRLNPTDFFVEPPGPFLAVYLDDACVTGKSLLNFLLLVSKARPDQLPIGILAIPMLSRLGPAEEQFYTTVCRMIAAGDETTSTIPFSFRPLFRLQVRSFEKLQSTFSHELASKIATQAFLDPRLQKYVGRILQRLDYDFAIEQRNSADLPALQHPFFSGPVSPYSPISARSIRIRHLIALQEQNVGVLGALLHELLDATQNDDFSLLTIIALELNLLEVPPLLKECRADILDLAMRAIISTTLSSAIKSDAMALVSMAGQELVRQMERILPAIGHDSDLLDQFLVFLITKVPRTNVWLDDVLNIIRTSKLPEEESLYISGYIKSVFEVAEPLSVKSSSDAIRAIENLIAQTSYHGKGLSSVNAVNDWLSKKEEVRIFTIGTEVQSKLREAIGFVRRTVLLGLAGMIWWAEYENANHAAAVDFTNARFQLIEALNHLESIGEKLKAGPIGSDVVISIESQWDMLRKYSNRIGPEYFLSQSIGPSEVEPTVLERWMPAFFCLPFELLKKLSQAYLPQAKVTNSWDGLGKGLSIVMATTPLTQVIQIFQLLLSDMKSHGNDSGSVIRLHVTRTQGSKTLSIDFEDRVRVDDTPGTGRSQSKVQSLAEPLGLTVKFDPPRSANQLYRVRVSLPDVITIKCY
jgi:hypothetical protein